MLSRNALALFILTLSLSHNLRGQNQIQFDLQSFVENYISDQNQSANFELLYERLLSFRESPIDLNQVDQETLTNLGLLSTSQIQTFLEYLSKNGRIYTLYELIYLEGFDTATVNTLLPFIFLGSRPKDYPSLLKRVLSERNNYLLLRYERVLENKRGYDPGIINTDKSYRGSPNKLLLRYRVSKTGDFSFGFTTEKDPGESFKWSPSSRSYGIDFLSAHAFFEKQGKWRKLVLGDYQLQFGQGLIFGSGFSVGKSSETINGLARVNRGISPNTSVIEGGFLRGAAAAYEFTGRLKATVFFSNLWQDANIQSESNERFENYFSAIQITGMHRTNSELKSRKQVNESIYGFEMGYQTNANKRISVVVAMNKLSLPILKSHHPRNLYEFFGRQNYNLGINGNFRWKRFFIFGEIAKSKSSGLGRIIGLTTQLSRRVDLGMTLRSYDRNFHSIKGSAFGENSRNINESGIYWGIKYKLNKKFYLSAYYDSYRFPWLKSGVNKPSAGQDHLIRLNYTPNPNTKIYLQYRGEKKEENFSNLNTQRTIVLPGKAKQYQLSSQYKISPHLNGRTRIQFSSYNINVSATTGHAFIQDINYSLPSLSVSVRMAIFDTQGAKNRQYVYERDVLYAFSVPGYSGTGVRNYLLLQYKLNRQLDVWVRIARTTFYDRNEIGTGLETIAGNKRTDVKFQIRYKIR